VSSKSRTVGQACSNQVAVRKVVEVSKLGASGCKVILAVSFRDHVLLNCLSGVPLRSTIEALMIAQDDQLEVGKKGSDVDQ
jgi:hypothetical protein